MRTAREVSTKGSIIDIPQGKRPNRASLICFRLEGFAAALAQASRKAGVPVPRRDGFDAFWRGEVKEPFISSIEAVEKRNKGISKMTNLNEFKVFDSHFHIIDKRFPLVPNQGYLPDNFSVEDYQRRTRDYDIAGGAIVSGSFQAFDQSYLLAALKQLGPNFVGVTQLPATVSDNDLLSLNEAGVRAVRFNLKRGGAESVENLERFGNRVHETVGWHTELYVDSTDLSGLHKTLAALPSVCIDHLGLSRAGFSDLLSLVDKGVHVKATGFGRVDFDVKKAIKAIININPGALVFGTDLPSTRAPKPYSDNDLFMVIDAIGVDMARKVFYENAIDFYRPKKQIIE